MKISRRGKTWTVASGHLQAEIDLKDGGKIRRLSSRLSRRNFFFVDPRGRLEGRLYLQHDISGWDECFPTVGFSSGRFGQDHGVLWDVPWEAYRQGRQLITRISRPHGMPVICTRIVTAPEENAIRFDYTLVNLSNSHIPFIYAAHSILAVDPRTRLRLPGVDKLSVLGHDGQLKANQQQAWPVAGLKNGRLCRLDTHFTPERKLSGKWFAAHCHKAHVTFPSTRETLTLTWDAKQLPYLGLWLSLGVPLDPGAPAPGRWICAALEPSNFDHDIIHEKKTPRLKPRSAYSFWIQWKLSCREKIVKRARRRLLLRRFSGILPGK
ncbi:hypothetical protein JW933_05245 [candidate division FCPU426 bacterium]|nr:hypothetical protein [candidate division FCPU426 bacterium]